MPPWPLPASVAEALPVLAGALVGGALTAVVLSVRHHLARRRLEREAVRRSAATLKGQISEQLAPHLGGDRFPWAAADARFLGHPIDYVVFDGYGAGEDDVEIVLVEVKTGRARLSDGQRKVRRAIEEGRVRFAEVRL